jgi:hypothetical protein
MPRDNKIPGRDKHPLARRLDYPNLKDIEKGIALAEDLNDLAFNNVIPHVGHRVRAGYAMRLFELAVACNGAKESQELLDEMWGSREEIAEFEQQKETEEVACIRRDLGTVHITLKSCLRELKESLTPMKLNKPAIRMAMTALGFANKQLIKYDDALITTSSTNE